MALSTRDGLIAAIPSHMMNNTQLSSAVCADFILMVEAEANRELRGRVSTSRAVAIVEDEYAVVPDDFLGEISFRLDVTGRSKLTFKTLDAFDGLIASYPAAGRPLFFTVVGGEFRFLPAPDDDYTGNLVYWQKVPALTDGSDSNWLLDSHPDVYLYGCLMHAAAFLKDDSDTARYEAWFARALGDVGSTEIEAGQGGSLEMTAGAVV